MTFTSANVAYGLARQGEFKLLRSCKVSLHFSWGEVFKNRTDTEIKACPEFVFYNAIKQAERLELVRHILGKPMRVVSWYRTGSTNHESGLATDFEGTYIEHIAIWNAAIKCGWQGGMGIAFKGHQARLHLDSRLTPENRPFNREWYYFDGKAVNSPKPKRKIIA